MHRGAGVLLVILCLAGTAGRVVAQSYASALAVGKGEVFIAEPEAPHAKGFDTVPFGEDTPEMSGAWNNYPFFKSGTIVVNSVQEGLFVLRRSERPLIP